MQPATFSIAVNDYGFELATATDIGWREALRPARRLLWPTTICCPTRSPA